MPIAVLPSLINLQVNAGTSSPLTSIISPIKFLASSLAFASPEFFGTMNIIRITRHLTLQEKIKGRKEGVEPSSTGICLEQLLGPQPIVLTVILQSPYLDLAKDVLKTLLLQKFRKLKLVKLSL